MESGVIIGVAPTVVVEGESQRRVRVRHEGAPALQPLPTVGTTLQEGPHGEEPAQAQALTAKGAVASGATMAVLPHHLLPPWVELWALLNIRKMKYVYRGPSHQASIKSHCMATQVLQCRSCISTM